MTVQGKRLFRLMQSLANRLANFESRFRRTFKSKARINPRTAFRRSGKRWCSRAFSVQTTEFPYATCFLGQIVNRYGVKITVQTTFIISSLIGVTQDRIAREMNQLATVTVPKNPLTRELLYQLPFARFTVFYSFFCFLGRAWVNQRRNSTKATFPIMIKEI